MKTIIKTLLVIAVAITLTSCRSRLSKSFQPRVVFTSRDLVVTQLTENSFAHTSFLQTDDFGKVPCNGLIVCDNNEAVIFDTPTNDTSAQALIKWVTEKRNCNIKAIIPTHFHNDCLGGLKAFNEHNIPSYAYSKTIALAKENGFAVPGNSFDDSLIVAVGNKNVIVKFFGAGHTSDNVVAYFPAEHVMFGGCLVKETGAGKGYLGDANVASWSRTVENVKAAYPKVNIIVPGHGKYGGVALLDYTINLFKTR